MTRIIFPSGFGRQDARAVVARSEGFDPRSAGWELSADGVHARHNGADGAPAILLAASGYTSGDRQVTFRIVEAPVGASARFGLCGADHSPGLRLGWAGSVGVGPDGVIRGGGSLAALGRLAIGDRLTVRTRRGQAFFRLEPDGAWNGDPAADPLSGLGGLDLPATEVFAAVISDTPGFEVAADFSGWAGSEPTFDPSPSRTSLAWELTEDRLGGEHRCAEAAPATVLGAPLDGVGDHELAVRLDALPAGSDVQLGLCNASHLRDNGLGWRNSLGLGLDGVLRQCGRPSGVHLRPLSQGTILTLRLVDGEVFFRSADGPWNGDPAADPDQGAGGVPLGFAGPLHPAVYADTPGVTVTGDFSRWRAVQSGRVSIVRPAPAWFEGDLRPSSRRARGAL